MKLAQIVDDMIERHRCSDHTGAAYVIRCVLGCAALFGAGFLGGVVLTLVFRALSMWIGAYWHAAVLSI